MLKFVVFYFEEKQNKTLPKTFNRIIIRCAAISRLREISWIFHVFCVNNKTKKITDLLTSVAKLGRREFDPLRLPFSIGGLASGDSLFLSTSLRMFGLSGVSSILEFSTSNIEAIALVLSAIHVAKPTSIMF